jgi:hypothetical protein
MKQKPVCTVYCVLPPQSAPLSQGEEALGGDAPLALGGAVSSKSHWEQVLLGGEEESTDTQYRCSDDDVICVRGLFEPFGVEWSGVESRVVLASRILTAAITMVSERSSPASTNSRSSCFFVPPDCHNVRGSLERNPRFWPAPTGVANKRSDSRGGTVPPGFSAY